MSNFLFGGYEYTNNLQASFKLQNLIQTQATENQEMLLSLFNKAGDGYSLITKTLHGADPKFCIDKKLNNVTTNILTYDGATSTIDLLSNIDLKGIYKITGGVTPTNDSDYATKGYVDLVEGVTSVGITTSTDGLTITNTPITSTGDINVDLSTQLQNLSSLSTLGLVNRTGSNTFATIPAGTSGQFLKVGSNGAMSWEDLDANLTSLAGLSTDGVLYKSSNTFSSLAIPAGSGKIIQTNNGAIEWVTPASGGNVTGSGTSTINALLRATDTTCTATTASDITVEFDTDLKIPGLIKVDTFKTTNDIALMHYDSNESRVYFDKTIRIPDGVGYDVNLSYGYLNSGGNTGTGSGTITASIDCHNRIIANEFNAHSSKTIKNIIAQGEIIEEEGLELFNKITTTKYNYKDVVKEGSGEYFGIIAEELQKVLPQCVDNFSQFVPNIYQKGSIRILDNNNYIVTFAEKEKLFLSSEQTIKIHGKNSSFVSIIKESDSNSDMIKLTIESSDNVKDALGDSDEVFVYGTYEYSPTVAYNKLWGVGFVALKAVNNKVKRLEQQVQDLVLQVTQLTNQGV